MLDKQHLAALVRRHGQEHLLQFWDELSPRQQHELAKQIQSVDFDALETALRQRPDQEDITALARRAEPPNAIRLSGNSDSPENTGHRTGRGGHPRHPAPSELARFSREEARLAGAEALKHGRVGVVLVAGGQGTRLGFHHPKGMYPIGPVSGHSLFQILFEKILAVGRRYGREIPIYLMTSPATHLETLQFLAEHQRFGVSREQLAVFSQGTMPAVDRFTGKVLLAEKGELALAPDGHGGLVQALVRHGLLEEMQQRGLTQLNYLQVDNPLAAACDVDFVGYHLLWGAEVSLQVIAKRALRDTLGNVVRIDGQTRVLEYSELNPLPDDILLRTTPQGERVFWAGSSGVHLLNVEFLARQARRTEGLPFHLAYKEVPFIAGDGQLVKPRQPNAIKLERFIFDLLSYATEVLAYEVDGRASYAPVKNAPGSGQDTPEQAQAQMMALYREWLRAAGIHVPDDKKVEIRPLTALGPEDLAPHAAPGQVFLV